MHGWLRHSGPCPPLHRQECPCHQLGLPIRNRRATSVPATSHTVDKLLQRLDNGRQQHFGALDFAAHIATHLDLEKRLTELGRDLIDHGRHELQGPRPNRKEVQVEIVAVEIHAALTAKTHSVAVEIEPSEFDAITVYAEDDMSLFKRGVIGQS